MLVHNRSAINILVVDDEENIVEFIKMGLEAEGYTVHTAYDGMEAIKKAMNIVPAIVILDIMLPKVNGFEACMEIKKVINTSIIMLTAKDEIDDRVRGLDIGADDYMVKPFSFKELVSRINARLRNSYKEIDEVTIIGDFKIDDKAHEISYKARVLQLSLTEYNILNFLLLNQGTVMSKKTILEKVWGYDFNGEENIVEVYIKYLRDKLHDSDYSIIKTVRGVGYRMVTK